MTTTDRNAYSAEVRTVLLRWLLVLLVVGLFALWATWRMGLVASRLSRVPGVTATDTEVPEPVVSYWTCTMHPDVRAARPGDCPRCGMKLVPKYQGSDELGVPPAVAMPTDVGPARGAKEGMWYKCTMPECNDVGSSDPEIRCPVCGMKREPVELEPQAVDRSDREITLSERAQRLAELATEPVAYRDLFKRIRTVGKVSYDETRHKVVSAWAGGRIDRLFADFTGMVVNQGDHLVEIYSPELLSAQEELLQARQALKAISGSTLAFSRRGAEGLVESARRKLTLLGITEKQISELERTGEATTHLVTYAPLGGTIVRKAVMEGMYVKTGDVLYEIADLKRVWLLLDSYEADLPWVQPFQEVVVTAESLPGETFRGQIVFVDPVVDPMSRTIKVRVNVDNPRRRLKPEMFVTAEIRVAMGPTGRAATPQPRGTYVCPMHPWEASGAMATCPICEMDMVPVASVAGYRVGETAGPILSVPREAIMQTGERALAYWAVGAGRYLGVDVKLGPLAQDKSGRAFYPVLEGLEEGQRVVTRGNFVIDSQMQIAGKPSLFDARGLGADSGHEHGRGRDSGEVSPKQRDHDHRVGQATHEHPVEKKHHSHGEEGDRP